MEDVVRAIDALRAPFGSVRTYAAAMRAAHQGLRVLPTAHADLDLDFVLDLDHVRIQVGNALSRFAHASCPCPALRQLALHVLARVDPDRELLVPYFGAALVLDAWCKVQAQVPRDTATAPCPICLEEVAAETIMRPPCGHGVHARCARMAIQHDPRCPVCRVDVLAAIHAAIVPPWALQTR